MSQTETTLLSPCPAPQSRPRRTSRRTARLAAPLAAPAAAGRASHTGFVGRVAAACGREAAHRRLRGPRHGANVREFEIHAIRPGKHLVSQGSSPASELRQSVHLQLHPRLRTRLRASRLRPARRFDLRWLPRRGCSGAAPAAASLPGRAVREAAALVVLRRLLGTALVRALECAERL